MILIRQIQITRIRSDEMILNAEDVVKKLNNPWTIAASARPFKDTTTNLRNFKSVPDYLRRGLICLCFWRFDITRLFTSAS